MSGGLITALSIGAYAIVAAIVGGVSWALGEGEEAPFFAVAWPAIAGAAVVVGPIWGLSWCVFKLIASQREKASRRKREATERRRQIAQLEKELDIDPGLVAPEPEPDFKDDYYRREFEWHRELAEAAARNRTEALYQQLTDGVAIGRRTEHERS